MSIPAQHPATWLERYRPWRGRAEVGFWVVVMAVQLLANSITMWVDLRSAPFHQPFLLELSSILVVSALIPAVIAFERRFPLRWETLRTNLPWHLLGTGLFCLVHVMGMLALRKLGFLLAGSRYDVRDWLAMLGYEYLKDVRTYVLLLATVLGYRLLRLRLQGEARVLDAPEPAPGAVTLQAVAAPAEPVARPERFLVRKLRREFLIQANDIERLQAEGNYVGLHVNGHDYLVRATLGDFLLQLDPARFARVHRSHAVNLDRVAEIEPLDSGDARIRMQDGSHVPCSRRYRDALG